MIDERAEEIFADALELDDAAREAFLKRACGGDAGLRAQVENLLADAGEAETFFASITRGAGRLSEILPLRRDEPGTCIGPYTLVRRLGRGGFGVVWMAEQTVPVRRTVALKVIKAGMDSEEVLARFEAERQALALMEHPNIARVFDAGTSADGRPYFAMEMVRGEPVTNFCDAHKLDMRARLGIFLEVCAAVHHAHQKGIIHRDLKPSNVLVGMESGRPQVKVIDFGIAKAVTGRLTDSTLVTRLEQVLGTPVYMSPEQAGLGGQDIDTRSDIYALGVLLYEILVGVPPFDPKDLAEAGYDEMRRIVREVTPLRPSARVTTLECPKIDELAAARQVPSSRMREIIPADLDWIVMKALEKSRERRYASADALAEDARRFLNDEPVSARPPGTWYLLGKFARRHTAGLLAGAGIAMVLITTAAFSYWQAARARAAEKLAESRFREAAQARSLEARAREDAEAVVRFFQNIFELPNPETNGRDVKIADALDAVAEDVETEFARQPGRRALLEQTLGGTYAGLGLYAPAVKFLRSALASYEEAGEAHTGGALATMEELTDLLTRLGHYREAAELGTQHVGMLKLTDEVNSPRLLRTTTRRNQNWLASGRRAEAIASQTELVAALERLGPQGEAHLVLAQGALNAMRWRAGLESPSPTPAKPKRATPPPAIERSPEELAKSSQATLEFMRQDLTDARERSGEDSSAALDAQFLLASQLGCLGETKEATDLMRDALGKLKARYGETHLKTLKAESDWAYFLWRTGQFTESKVAWRASIKKRKEILGPKHEQTLSDQVNFADALFWGGQLEEATELASGAVDGLREVAGKSSELHHAMGILGRCRLRAGRLRQALETFQECGPWMSGDTYINLDLALLEAWFGLDADYEKTRARMLKDTRGSWDGNISRPDVYERTVVMTCLTPLTDAAQSENVRALIRRADEIRAHKGVKPTRFEPSLDWLSRCLAAYRLGDDAAVQAGYDEKLRFAGKPGSPDQKALACDFVQVMILVRRGKREEAQKLFDEVTAVLPPMPGPDPNAPPPEKSPHILPWIFQREAARMLVETAPGR